MHENSILKDVTRSARGGVGVQMGHGSMLEGSATTTRLTPQDGVSGRHAVEIQGRRCSMSCTYDLYRAASPRTLSRAERSLGAVSVRDWGRGKSEFTLALEF